jgi:hypothetical protein
VTVMTGNWTLEYVEKGVKHIHHLSNTIVDGGEDRFLNIDFGERMKTKTIIKKEAAIVSLLDASHQDLYEVTDAGSISGLLRVGDVVFKTPVYVYVIGAQSREVACYDWSVPTLQSIKVRKFQAGDSFTIEFQD